jgi:hypothetical protein
MLGENFRQVISNSAVFILMFSQEYMLNATYTRELEEIYNIISKDENGSGKTQDL